MKVQTHTPKRGFETVVLASVERLISDLCNRSALYSTKLLKPGAQDAASPERPYHSLSLALNLLLCCGLRIGGVIRCVVLRLIRRQLPSARPISGQVDGGADRDSVFVLRKRDRVGYVDQIPAAQNVVAGRETLRHESEHGVRSIGDG